MSRVVCRLSAWLPDNTPLLSRVFERHRAGCLRCQADAVRLRGVSRDLGTLEDETFHAPGGLHTQVMATRPRQDAADPRRPLLARVVARYVAGIGVAAATLVAIITRVWKKRD